MTMRTTLAHLGREYPARTYTSPVGLSDPQPPSVWIVDGIAGEFRTLETAHEAVTVDAEARDAVARLVGSHHPHLRNGHGMIYTDATGRPFPEPKPPALGAKTSEYVAYMRAKQEWQDSITDCANRGFDEEFRKKMK